MSQEFKNFTKAVSEADRQQQTKQAEISRREFTKRAGAIVALVVGGIAVSRLHEGGDTIENNHIATALRELQQAASLLQPAAAERLGFDEFLTNDALLRAAVHSRLKVNDSSNDEGDRTIEVSYNPTENLAAPIQLTSVYVGDTDENSLTLQMRLNAEGKLRAADDTALLSKDQLPEILGGLVDNTGGIDTYGSTDAEGDYWVDEEHGPVVLRRVGMANGNPFFAEVDTSGRVFLGENIKGILGPPSN